MAGNLLAVEALHQSAAAYGVGRQQVPWWASVIASAGLLGLTALAALGPALRAGRLSAVQAIAAGRAPRTGRGYAAHRLAARLRLPVRSASAWRRRSPARADRGDARRDRVRRHRGDLRVRAALLAEPRRGQPDPVRHGPGADPAVRPGAGPQQLPDAAQNAAVTAALRAQPGTRHEVAVYQEAVKVPGVAQNVNANVFGGDASWTGFGLIAGHWYGAPGEVDVNTAFLTQSGLAVGDTATVSIGTNPVTVRIAGEVFELSHEARLYGSAQTLPGIATTANLQEYDAPLRPGTSASAYIQAVNARLGSRSPWGATGPAHNGQVSPQIAIGLIGLLSLMVAVAAGLGVLNTVLDDHRVPCTTSGSSGRSACGLARCSPWRSAGWPVPRSSPR